MLRHIGGRIACLPALLLTACKHFWLTDWSYMSAAPSGTTRISSGLKMFDAQSGRKIRLEADGYPCGVPALRNGDTHVVLPTSDEPPDSFGGKYEQSPVRHCTGLAVYDTTTGHKTWGWTVQTSSPILALAIKGTAVQVHYDTGEEGCIRLTDGRRPGWSLTARPWSGPIGDITVMGVDQRKGFDSHLAGFRIPTAG